MEFESSAVAEIFIPDILTPGQYNDGRRANGCAHPVKRLMLAVLADAIHCYQTYVCSRGPAQRRLFVEAETWLMDRKAESAFAFETVCGALGIDPDCLREGLRRWRLRELDGKNPPRLTRRSPAIDASRMGSPAGRRRRNLPKNSGGCETDLADGGFAVAVKGNCNGDAIARPKSAVATEDAGNNQPAEVESFDGTIDMDDAGVNVHPWTAVPEVAAASF
jgi:hypothetical protein